MALGLNLDELIAMYVIQFPVLQQNELGTWYDKAGAIVFTSSKSLSGLALPRKIKCAEHHEQSSWEKASALTDGNVCHRVVDDTLPGGPLEHIITYEAPFDRCDRVEDYRIAWEFFEKEGIGA